jgi:hypothetical protein
MLESIEKTVALLHAPMDYALWNQAEKTVGELSPKAVQDEYDRLMLARLFPPRRKGAFTEETPPRCVRRTPIIWRGVRS